MTIKDIAAESGYSIGTVSRTLNHTRGVSETARKTIMEVVERNHFQLNNNARHLKRQGNDGIAVIVRGIQNMFFVAVVERIQELIQRHGYTCLLYYISEDGDEMELATQICQDRKPYGIVFGGSNSIRYSRHFEQITVPCVLATNSAAGLGYDRLSSVTTDDEAAAYYAIEHLIALGHRQIGVLGGGLEKAWPASFRYKGCLRAFADYGITFDYDRQFVEAHFSFDEGYFAMGRLLEQDPDLTAVFAMSDVMAFGAVRAIYDRGMRVPDDISIIGFDGLEMGNYMVPRLTSIRQDAGAIAEDSVEILLRNIEEGRDAVHKVEPFYLVPGETVKKIA